MTKILYSSVNEDSSSEIRALEITSDDVVFCITGSGARPLDLLTQAPRKIIALDMNCAQSHLLELQTKAITALSYSEFLAFLGLSNCSHRDDLYRALRPLLSNEAKLFWDGQRPMLLKGVFYQGNWEKYFAKLSCILRTCKLSFVEKLFTAKTLGDQAALWKNGWNTCLWSSFLQLTTSRFFFKTILQDPGFYEHVPKDFSLYDYFNGCLEKASSQFLFRDSAFARLLLLGALSPDIALPPYLREENFARLRANVQNVVIESGTMREYVRKLPAHSIDKFSLSDFSSNTSMPDYIDTWKQLIRVAKPGAIFFERQFLVKRELPQELQKELHEEIERIDAAAKNDRSIFYTFKVYSNYA